MSMRHHVERYITFKRQFGYKYVHQEPRLHEYAKYADARGEEHTSTGTILSWAQQAPSSTSARVRFSTARRFSIWMHAEDERHEIPPPGAFGLRRPQRPIPRVLTVAEIRKLLDAALTLPPVASITPHTYHYLFGLMAATGLRRSEAIGLRLTDITPDGLLIREAKFRKTRLVPLHDSVRTAVDRYLQIRNLIGGPDEHLFVISNGRPLSGNVVTQTYINLARKIGLREETGMPGPRLHDLRHAFAVRSLEAAVATDRQSVDRHTLALSTYLGHVGLSSTYWYLQATPTLLKHIAKVAEEAHARRYGR